MINLRRKDRFAEANAPLKPALYEPPGRVAQPPQVAATQASPPAVPRDDPGPGGSTPPGEAAPSTAAAAPARMPTAAGSKLAIGVNIKLKGVEISDCDVMVIEGHVEATVHSHVMEIAKPGTLKGTAMIDVAEIHGDFSGELTARQCLVVHGTGRVSGTIRYGKLIVAEGGELNGDVKRLDAVHAPGEPTGDGTPGGASAAERSDGGRR